MPTDDLSLSDDMNLLKAMVRAMAEKTVVLEGEIEELTARGRDAVERINRLHRSSKLMIAPGSGVARKS